MHKKADDRDPFGKRYPPCSKSEPFCSWLVSLRLPVPFSFFSLRLPRPSSPGLPLSFHVWPSGPRSLSSLSSPSSPYCCRRTGTQIGFACLSSPSTCCLSSSSSSCPKWGCHIYEFIIYPLCICWLRSYQHCVIRSNCIPYVPCIDVRTAATCIVLHTGLRRTGWGIWWVRARLRRAWVARLLLLFFRRLWLLLVFLATLWLWLLMSSRLSLLSISVNRFKPTVQCRFLDILDGIFIPA